MDKRKMKSIETFLSSSAKSFDEKVCTCSLCTACVQSVYSLCTVCVRSVYSLRKVCAKSNYKVAFLVSSLWTSRRGQILGTEGIVRALGLACLGLRQYKPHQQHKSPGRGLRRVSQPRAYCAVSTQNAKRGTALREFTAAYLAYLHHL
ncbi:hypothetical protein RRG08_042531 [Elysia crispata]|uniref:Uncharacterized protein n=1 Tax=Elysia crispata TaxID=231223 RepID=A0AAE0XQ86_9GAST|nr:hypothetical protein RRG08_042531 [Elysia crispata]